MTASPTAEYEALTDGCGYVLQVGWSIVTLTGADRNTFLNNMCTNDIKKLGPGQGCEAFCTDVKGKIQSHVFVFLGEEKTTLLTVPDQAKSIIASLDRYIIREDVQLADDTADVIAMLVSGNRSAGLLRQFTPIEVDQIDEPWQNRRANVNGHETLVVRFPLASRIAFLILTESSAARGLTEHLQQAGATSCGFAAWNTLRIESGLPLFGIDFSSVHLPQEVARDTQAISFTKGCYLGQETIARLDALGHVNRQLVTVKFNADTEPDLPVPLTYQDKQVGEATSAAASPVIGAPIGIAMLRREANAVGTVLDSPAGPVEVIATPAVG